MRFSEFISKMNPHLWSAEADIVTTVQNVQLDPFVFYANHEKINFFFFIISINSFFFTFYKDSYFFNYVIVLISLVKVQY